MGVPTRQDYEYGRHGKANLFVAVEPLSGWRNVRVTERHTRVDFAQELRFLVNEVYKEADQMVLVTDNLNIHHVACLYEAFCPSEARRIAGKIEWHYTPEHGSWLNREIAPGDFLDIAEIELSMLHRASALRGASQARNTYGRKSRHGRQPEMARGRRFTGNLQRRTQGLSYVNSILVYNQMFRLIGYLGQDRLVVRRGDGHVRHSHSFVLRLIPPRPEPRERHGGE